MPITIASIMNLMGPGHDGNPSHRVAPVRREKTSGTRSRNGRAVKEFSAARDEIERELLQRQGRL